MLALLAEKHMGVEWKQPHDQFTEAVRTAPENTAARNLLALSEVALWSHGGSDVNQVIRALTRVLLLRPNDLEALSVWFSIQLMSPPSPLGFPRTNVYPLDKACFRQICVYAHIFRGGRAADGYAMIHKNLDKGGCDFVMKAD